MKKYDVAIVGATGLVGEAFLEILAERRFPLNKVYALASERSVGKSVDFGRKSLDVENLAGFDFSKVQIAFFSAGSLVSQQYVPIAAEAGCIVIDNSSQFRYEPDVPLVIPEVNPEALESYRNRNIIANPNCSTIQMLVALKPIYDQVGIERIQVSTYQSVSGAGKKAIQELVMQTASLLNGQEFKREVLPKQIAFNVIPQIDKFFDNGYSKEEMKMVWETKKILGDENIQVNATTVRVPVFYGHSESVSILTKQPVTKDEVVAWLKNSPGIKVVDEGNYPTPIDVSGKDDVYVGRIRHDLNDPHSLNLWIVGDNIRKGAALNGVQIAESLVSRSRF